MENRGVGAGESWLEREKRRRRNLRFKQVRRLASEGARLARERTAERRRRALDELALRQLDAYRMEKEVELRALEDEYRACLRDIGEGHRGARREEEERRRAERRRREEVRAARSRGNQALRRNREERELEERLAAQGREAREGARLSERLRAAEVRSRGRERLARTGKVQLVEVDERMRKKVTLVDKSQLVADGRGKGVSVRRVPLSEVGNSGLEAAIREQEEERRVRETVRRREEQIRRQKREEEDHERRQQRVDSPRSEDEEDRSHRLSTITEEMTQQVADEHDVDLFPVRGPPSTSLSSSSGSSGRGGNVLDQEDLRNIRALLDQVERQKKELTEVAQLVSQSGGGEKNQDADREYVAKVLGIPPEQLGPTGKGWDNVQVKVNVQEVSTLQHTREVHQDQSSSTENSSESTILRERFLVQAAQERTFQGLTDARAIRTLIHGLRTSGSPDSSSGDSRLSSPGSGNQALLKHYIEKLIGMKRQEIAELSVSSTTSRDHSSEASEHLSSSNKETSPASNGGAEDGRGRRRSFVASTPSSILSTSSSKSSVGSSSGGSKTVRFRDELDASHPVRPPPRVGSSSDKLSQLELEQRRADIEARTRLSLLQIQTTFEEERRRIEEALERRYARRVERSAAVAYVHSSVSSSTLSTTISEGKLSDSSTAAGSDELDADSERRVVDEMPEREMRKSFSESNLSRKELSTSGGSTSSLSEKPVCGAGQRNDGGIDRMLEGLQLNWAQSMLRRMKGVDQQQGEASTQARLNKSSSSGSSGSTAVAKLREALAAMEVPRLQPPPPRRKPADEANKSSVARTDNTLAEPGLSELQSSATDNDKN